MFALNWELVEDCGLLLESELLDDCELFKDGELVEGAMLLAVPSVRRESVEDWGICEEGGKTKEDAVMVNRATTRRSIDRKAFIVRSNKNDSCVCSIER